MPEFSPCFANAQPGLNGRHGVFGQVVGGFSVLKAIESVGATCNPLGFTSQEVIVKGCGLLSPEEGVRELE